MFFIHVNTPADHNAIYLGEQTDAEPRPPFSPFMNIVEQAIIKCVQSGNQGWHIKTKHSRTGTWPQRGSQARHSFAWESFDKEFWCKPVQEIWPPSPLLNALLGIGSCRTTFLVAWIANIFNGKWAILNFDYVYFFRACFVHKNLVSSSSFR